MLLPIMGSLFIWVMGYAAYDHATAPVEVQSNIESYEKYDDKTHMEIWCDCLYVAKCKNEEKTDTLAGYRGRGFREAKRNSCRMAKSYASSWCFRQESELELFAIRGHKCFEEETE